MKTQDRDLPKKRHLPGWLLLGLAVAVLGCIDTYDAGFASGGNYLVVDAALNNTSLGRSVKLALAGQPFGYPSTTAITNAQVQLQPSDGGSVSLGGTGGTYSLPATYALTPGKTYTLLIQLADGRKYSSDPETMPAIVPIQKLYRNFDPKGFQTSVLTNGTAAAQNLLVDLQDPAGQANFYQWTYIVWEKQLTCATCTDGLYDNITGKCTPLMKPTGATYDYSCDGNCWQIIKSTASYTTTDLLFNGKALVGRLAGVLPVYQLGPCLVSVQQRSLSAGAYRYTLILADQGQNTGGLADTPPAGLVGNLHNLTKADEQVLGYFSVSGVSEILYWNDRSDVPGNTAPLGLLGGRRFNPEPSGTYGPLRPPLAPCLLIDGRTPTKPVGWQG